MSRLEYVVGDATAPTGSGAKLIAHICNDLGKWGSGFVIAVSRRWREPEARYRAWAGGMLPGAGFALGNIQPVRVEDDLWVVNMVAQHRLKSAANPVPLRYDALEQCLAKLADFALAKGASVHCPRIGCDRGGGDWERVEALLLSQVVERGVPVTVYDLPR